MPPKKNEPPPPPPEDTNPYGVFVSIGLQSANLNLDLTPEAAKDPAAQPKTHITLHIPGCHVPWASPPTPASEGGTYVYAITKHFRRSEEKDVLLQLANGKLTVTVNESTTNTVLGTATVDELWGFAIGDNSWSSDREDLTPASQPEGAPPPATPVPKLRSGHLSGLSISLQRRPLPEGADPATALAPSTAPPPPEEELPPMQPFSFVSPEQQEEANLVELAVTELSPLPQNLQAAADAAGGKLTVNVGVSLPGGPTVVVPVGVSGGRLVAPAVRRELFPPEARKPLQYHLEDGLPLTVELARYVTADAMSDPAFEAYRAVAAAPSLAADLTAAGATLGTAEGLELVPFASAGVKTILPPYTPPAGKAKPVEEAAPAGTCHWHAAGSRLSVTLRFARPVVPAWRPPPPPPKPLLELIPPRDLTPKPPPTTAADELKAKVRDIARALAAEYKAVLPPPQAPQEPGAGGGAAAASAAMDTRHKALIFELNRSGKYGQMRDSLKSAVVALVREKYRKSGSMSPNEMALLYNDLYGTLLAAVHSALNDIVDGAAARPRQPPPEPVPDRARLGQLLELAAQAEALGDTHRAEALHQRRLVAKLDPQVWYEYGTYCLRRGARGRAEQCFREALSLEPCHRASLLALLGCSVAEGRATDPSYLEAAEAAAHRLLEVVGSDSLEPWAALALVYKAFGDSKKAELASCEQELTRLERQQALAAAAAAGHEGGQTPGLTPQASRRAVGGGQQQPPSAEPSSASALSTMSAGSAAIAAAGLQARAFLSLAGTMLEALGLPGEAATALAMAAGLRTWAAAPRDLHVAHALALAQTERALGRNPAELLSQPGHAAGTPGGGGGVGVLALMRVGNDVAPGVAWRARLLAAQLYRTQGALEEAIRYYQEYIEVARDEGRLSEVALPVWLELARCYSLRGQPRHAADVCLLGASANPTCAALWRVAGESFVAEGDLDSADNVLSEANVLDPEDPLAWGLLALVALRQGRQDDGAKALSTSLRLGLDDAGVLLDVAAEYRGAGQRRAEQRVLQEVAGRLLPDSCGVRLLLARCLVAQRCGPEAAEAVAAARALASVDDDLAAVEELEQELRGMAA